MNFDINYFKEIANKIFNVDSPSGYSENINKLLIELLADLGQKANLTNKGNVYVKIEGNQVQKQLQLPLMLIH